MTDTECVAKTLQVSHPEKKWTGERRWRWASTLKFWNLLPEKVNEHRVQMYTYQCVVDARFTFVRTYIMLNKSEDTFLSLLLMETIKSWSTFR